MTKPDASSDCKLLLQIFRHQQEVDFDSSGLSGLVELGRRQFSHEPAPYGKLRCGLDEPKQGARVRWRVIVADLKETDFSREHVWLEPLGDGRVRITNISKQHYVHIDDHGPLAPGQDRLLESGARFAFGDLKRTGGVTVRVVDPSVPQSGLFSLPHSSLALGSAGDVDSPMSMASLFADAPAEIARRLQIVARVLASAAGGAEFYRAGAQAVVDIARLDSAGLVMFETTPWAIVARANALGVVQDDEWQPSRRLVNHVRATEKPCWEKASVDGFGGGSLADVQAFVAAPVFDREGRVIGVLCGDRRRGRGGPADLGELEAGLVHLIAGSLTAGLLRQAEERRAAEADVRFAQFFSPQLARRLKDDPGMLDGRSLEITVLFCDVRGFSRVSERLEPAEVVAWMRDVLDALSECVIAHEGVLVDYVGDELFAMWGAPEPCGDHAHRACLAALDMIAALPAVSDRWREKISAELQVGIGINTGKASVGNVGSRRKFKYGPVGSTVNLGSRVQGATKHFGATLLVTGATVERLEGSGLFARRLRKVRVVNIEQPVDVYELVIPDGPGWHELKTGYEAALVAFETLDFELAFQRATGVAHAHAADRPSQVLLEHILHCKYRGAAEFAPSWTLPGK